MLLSNYSSGSTNEDILEVGNYSLSCEGCLDYDDCPYPKAQTISTTPFLNRKAKKCVPYRKNKTHTFFLFRI